ncbi:MAG: quinone oxidoreductase [Labilithrix sp.]|nr:quinone oxidoreductase [Labilithrix sp.]
MAGAHAVRMHEVGAPDVLRWEPIELPEPGPGEVRVRHTAIGLNFIDTYHRTGLYPVPLPAVLGSEAVGVVEALGDGVTGFAAGDRVGYATGPMGAYAEARNITASVVVKIPPGVDDDRAAASLLKGMTAHYLLDIGRLRESPRTILVHAAAGGVGLLLCQWAKRLGATVIGTVGSEAKAKLALASGCDEVIRYDGESVAKRVHAITNGKKVDVVYDSVGKDTWSDSLASLRPRGMMVSFGQSSGPVAPFEPRVLAANGSLFFTRPTLFDYVRERAELEARARDLFAALEEGALNVRVGQTYPLREAARAHRDLEGRKTTGSTLLVP